MKSSGFTLVEVAIGSLVGSLLLASLYMTINTLSKTMFKLNERHEQVNELMIVYDLLEKDLTSQYVALDLLKTGTQQINPDMGFVCFAKDKKIDQLSCVCMHPRAQYNSLKPAPIRVVYQFSYNKEKTNLQVHRFESNTLAWPACKKEIDEKKVKGILLSDAMQTIEPSLFAYSRVEKPKEEADKNFATFKQWDPQEIYKKTKRLIPDFISFEGIMGDENQSMDFMFDFNVPVHDPEPKDVPQKQPDNPKLPAPPKGGGLPGNGSFTTSINFQTNGVPPQPSSKDSNGKPA